MANGQGLPWYGVTVDRLDNLYRENSPGDAPVNFKHLPQEEMMDWVEKNRPQYLQPLIKNPRSDQDFHDSTVPVGRDIKNPAYIQDWNDYKASKEPEHLAYLGFNIEQMATDFGAGLAGAMGTIYDPDGLALARAQALEKLAEFSEPLKYVAPFWQYGAKFAANISRKGIPQEGTPEYIAAKKQAREWYDISNAYLKTGEMMAAERMANDPKVRAYFRWMDDEPMTWDNMFHADQFKMAMVQMAPSVAAITGVTVVTGGGWIPATAAMFGMEGSSEFAEAQRILMDHGRIKIDPETGKAMKGPDGQELREKLTFEEAAPISGLAALIHSAIAAPAEAFQIGKATRLLKMGNKARRSGVFKVVDRLTKNEHKLAHGILKPVDYFVEAVEGGAVEWFQNTTQMIINKAVEEGYGDTPEEAFAQLAKSIGPGNWDSYLDPEIGMSEDAIQAFRVGLLGEAGFSTSFGAARGVGLAAGGAAGGIYKFAKRKKGKPTTTELETIPGEDIAPVPTTTDIVTETGAPTESALTVVTFAKEKSTAAIAYATLLGEQVTKGELFGQRVNRLITRAGGSPNEDINKLIKKDERQAELNPELKAYNLIQSLEDEPEIRTQVLEIINASPLLKGGVALLQKEVAKGKLPDKFKGTKNIQSAAENAIDDIPNDIIMENLDNVEEIVNEKFDQEGIDIALEIAEEQALEKAAKERGDVPGFEQKTDDAVLAKADEAAIEAEAAKQMGVSVAEYRKQVAESTKVKPLPNINKVEAGEAVNHLVDMQRQAGTLGVKTALEGNKKKKIAPANLTTLKKLQKAIFQEERITTTDANRGAIIDLISDQIFKDVKPTQKPTITKPVKAPVKKKVVPAVAKKKAVTETEVIPDTGEITVYRDGKKTSVTVENPTDNVAGAIQVQLTGLDASDPTGKTTPIKDADTLVVPGNQATLIRQMQQMKVPGAEKIKVGKSKGIFTVNDDQADPFIHDFFKDSFKQIRYNNKQMPKKGVDFHDLTKDEFVGTDPIISKQYKKQRKARDLKKKAPAKPDVKKMDVKFGDTQGQGFRLVSELMGEEVQSRIKGKTIVDLGSGATYSEYKDQMKAEGAEDVVGVDPNFEVDHKQDMLSFLRNQADNSTDVITMNAIEFGGPDYLTVGIVGKDAKKYQEEVFKEIDRVVKPGGSLIGSSTTEFLDIPGWNKTKEDTAVIYDKPAKKKREPLAAETADKLIDDIIGAPNVSSKTKSKIKTITKETQAKQDAAIQKAEEIDSTTEDINDKLDEDLCI